MLVTFVHLPVLVKDIDKSGSESREKHTRVYEYPPYMSCHVETDVPRVAFVANLLPNTTSTTCNDGGRRCSGASSLDVRTC